jgi:hypothetical protein
VKPGGTLLIVGHHPSDLQATIHRPRTPEVYFTASDAATALDTDDWDIVVRAARSRTEADSEGCVVAVQDAVLRARRRG